jgi:hypothetical protein
MSRTSWRRAAAGKRRSRCLLMSSRPQAPGSRFGLVGTKVGRRVRPELVASGSRWCPPGPVQSRSLACPELKASGSQWRTRARRAGLAAVVPALKRRAAVGLLRGVGPLREVELRSRSHWRRAAVAFICSQSRTMASSSLWSHRKWADVYGTCRPDLSWRRAAVGLAPLPPASAGLDCPDLKASGSRWPPDTAQKVRRICCRSRTPGVGQPLAIPPRSVKLWCPELTASGSRRPLRMNQSRTMASGSRWSSYLRRARTAQELPSRTMASGSRWSLRGRGNCRSGA